jgi:hypothetical protein
MTESKLKPRVTVAVTVHLNLTLTAAVVVGALLAVFLG